jgi:cyanophycinase-like exopeptidase
MGTSVQTLIQSKVANVSVGGTSAGCAVLGNFIYTGEKGSVSSGNSTDWLLHYSRVAQTLLSRTLTIEK